jgi:hypothetical protein
MRCAAARRMVSERLDGPDPGRRLDLHLAGCAGCRGFAASTAEIRRSLRFEPVAAVPDVAAAMRRALGTRPVQPPRPARTSRRAAVAALAAGIVIGATLVGVGRDRPEPVAAAELPRLVAAAQAAVDGLHAEVRLVERGWNPQVPERRFSGTLDYRAPESLALSWRDRTAYPSGAWRPDDVDLLTDGRSWVATGLADCPSDAQPGCTPPPRERAVTGRPPFSEDAPVPLELIVPVRSFATTDTARVVGDGEVAGRETVEVEVTASQVGPLLAGLRPAGNLRLVHDTDTVVLSLDADLMVPLRIEVRASAEPERQLWADQQGYADHPGLTVLDLEVTDLDLSAPDPENFVPPAAAPAADAGYRDGDAELGLDPEAPAGFSSYRVGHLTGATPAGVWSWSNGRAWIRLTATRRWTGSGLFGDLGALVRSQPSAAGEVYVSADGRRVGLHGANLDLVVDGSIPTSALVAVVEDLGVPAVDLPASWPEQRTAGPDAVRRALPGALGLAAPGFGSPAARLEGDSVVQFATGSGDRRLLLVQVPGATLSPPLENDYETPTVRGEDGRYTPAAGQLEWLEDGRLITLRGTGLTEAELVAVAEGLEPL